MATLRCRAIAQLVCAVGSGDNKEDLELGHRSCLHHRHNSSPCHPCARDVALVLPLECSAVTLTQQPPSQLDAVIFLPEQHAVVGAVSRDQNFETQKTPLSSGSS